jgi:hypothetical protein
VHIEITSTLTLEDEDRMASAVLKTMSAVFDMLPIAYLIRIQTTEGRVIQHVGPDDVSWGSPIAETSKAPRAVAES